MSTLISLESVHIANPCSADWGKMQGDDRVRFCQSCAKNVFNLSELSRVEAEKLITEKQGNLCVQYYQRADGTILTDDCPVSLKIVRRPFKWLAASFAALLVAAGATQASTPVKGEPAPSRVKSKPVKRVIAGGLVYRPAPKPTPTPKSVKIIRGRTQSSPKPKPKE